MTADTLLSRLDRVRETGRGRWLARCPAHDDGSPSLSIRELDDGRLLLHCFAGCSVTEIVAAVGLTVSCLFPEGAVDHHVRRERHPFNPLDVLRALADEALIVAIVGARTAYGHAITWTEIDRLMTAAGRIAGAAVMFDSAPARRAILTPRELDEALHA